MFFLRSMWTEPARQAVITDGGTCRNPGPIFNGMEGLAELGSSSEEMLSPGRMRDAMTRDVMV